MEAEDKPGAWHRNLDKSSAWHRNLDKSSVWHRNLDKSSVWHRNVRRAWSGRRRASGISDGPGVTTGPVLNGMDRAAPYRKVTVSPGVGGGAQSRSRVCRRHGPGLDGTGDPDQGVPLVRRARTVTVPRSLDELGLDDHLDEPHDYPRTVPVTAALACGDVPTVRREVHRGTSVNGR